MGYEELPPDPDPPTVTHVVPEHVHTVMHSGGLLSTSSSEVPAGTGHVPRYGPIMPPPAVPTLRKFTTQLWVKQADGFYHVNHNLNTRDILIQVWGPKQESVWLYECIQVNVNFLKIRGGFLDMETGDWVNIEISSIVIIG